MTLHDGDTIAVLPERRGRAEEIDHTFWFAVFNGVGTHGTGDRAKVGTVASSLVMVSHVPKSLARVTWFYTKRQVQREINRLEIMAPVCVSSS